MTKMIAAALFVTTFLTVALPVAMAASITVNETADELNSDGDCSLREAIEAANTNAAVDGCTAGSGADTINVPAGTYTLSIAGQDEDDNQTGDLDITDTLILEGEGAATTILDGGAIDRVLHVACEESFPFDPCIGGPSAVTIRGVTVRNGSSASYGGGLLSDATASSSTITLEDCRFTGNTAATGGGGVLLQGGSSGGSVIRRCEFDGNTATGGDGGALYNVFYGLTIEDCTFTNNSAADWGGAIFTANSSPMVRRTLLSFNSASNGGAISVKASFSTIILENVTISANQAIAGDGGGIAIGGAFSDGEVIMSHSTVTGNSATGLGGGVAVFFPPPPKEAIFNVKNSIIADNSGTTPDVSGAVVSNDFNIVGDDIGATGFTGADDQVGVDPLLGPLGDYGGLHHTHELLVGSPAIDAGSCTDNAGAPVTEDQRGISRPQGATCEIGAFECIDSDGDTVCDRFDNCPSIANGPSDASNQVDSDGDGVGDVCDVCEGDDAIGDIDGDGRCSDLDNCPFNSNDPWTDTDGDGIGDACDDADGLDVDGDGDPNTADNCPFVSNSDQADADGDGLGDVCDPSPNDPDPTDVDGDGDPNTADNCPFVANSDQADADGDGLGDVCDDADGLDVDGDGDLNTADNCPFVANSDQADADGDGLGDVCDPSDNLDADGDGVANLADNCPFAANGGQEDVDADGLGDACDAIDNSNDTDADKDGIENADDNCPLVVNENQADADGDGLGDACDTSDDLDLDGDGIANDVDNCAFVANPAQEDSDRDGLGDECDPQELTDDGCNVAAGGGPPSWWLLVIGAAMVRRRRR